jgi:hypothetical protein
MTERDMKINQQMKLICEIKKQSKPGDKGQYECICREQLNYRIAGNGHIWMNCPHCNLTAIE